MPADYLSTARALALPISPPESPGATRRPVSPPWRRSRSSSSGVARTSATSAFRDDLQNTAMKLQRQGTRIIQKMNWWQRILAAIGLVVAAALGILFLIFNERIFAWLHPAVMKFRTLKGGWVLSWLLIFVCAFPPMIGYSSVVTMMGFLYGLRTGWLIAASSTVVGSLCSFLVSRTILASYVERLTANDKRFAALALTLKHDGLKLLCMIRLCPLPYSLSNGAIATFPTVEPWKFAMATAIATPKLAIGIFIGGRLSDIAEHGGKMSIGTKLINYASIAFGVSIGISVGWIIYQRTMRRAQQLESEERARLADSAVIDEGGAAFSDDVDSDAADFHPTNEDDISLFEHGHSAEAYRDQFTDDDLFHDGDEDIEQTAGLPSDTDKTSK